MYRTPSPLTSPLPHVVDEYESSTSRLEQDSSGSLAVRPRVVTLFTEAYVHTTLKHGRLVEGGRVSMPLPQSCALLRAVDPRFPHSLDIFDFSERHVMRRAAEARPSPHAP